MTDAILAGAVLAAMTALAVHVEVHPTHIAELPVAVNLGCHSMRRLSTVL